LFKNKHKIFGEHLSTTQKGRYPDPGTFCFIGTYVCRPFKGVEMLFSITHSLLNLYDSSVRFLTFGLPTFGLSTFGLPTFGLRTFGLPIFGLPTFGLMTFGLRTFGLPTFGLPTLPTFVYRHLVYHCSFYLHLKNLA
jgi:hypothetical protein